MFDIGRITRPIVNIIKAPIEGAAQAIARVVTPPSDSFEKAAAGARPAAQASGPAPGAVLTEKQTTAFAALPREDQARYNRVFESVGNDYKARSAVRVLLASGSLTSSHASGDGGSLLQQLDGLSRGGKLKDGIPAAQLQSQLVQDLARPEAISQGADNAICGATAALTDLALSKPAEYARLVVGMATHGEVKLGDGGKDAMHLKYRRLSQENANDRSLTQRLLAVPLLESAVTNGKVGEDGEVLTREGGWKVFGLHLFGKKVVTEGTVSDQMEAMKSALHRGRQDDEAFESMYLGSKGSAGRPVPASQTLEVIQEQLANHANPALKIVNGAEGTAHWVTVHGYDEASGKLLVANGRGGIERADPEALLAQADALTYDTTLGQSSRKASNAPTIGQEQAGGGGKLSVGSGSIEDL